MKTIKMSILSGALVLLFSATAFLLPQHDTAKAKTGNITAGNGFVVLELFTSEGCSSCPPADELLARVQKDAGNKPIYVLAYHVDYWNRLGWKDVFSDAQYTERQNQYSRRFAGQVYTPQVVINGQSECVGSDETAVNDGIRKALVQPAAATLAIEVQQTPGNTDINYQVTGSINSDQLLLAVVQKHAVNKIMRGENEGRTLTHVQIVRKLYAFNLKTGKGAEHISLPAGFNMQDWEIIGMIQDQRTGAITAAVRASIN